VKDRQRKSLGSKLLPLASAVRCFRETKAICPNAPLKVIYFNWFTLKNIDILSTINSKVMEELFVGCKGRMEKNIRAKGAKVGDGALRRASQQRNTVSW